MELIQDIDLLIVGAGPAGMSTALHLLKLDPGWARRILIVDKAVHPREKLCGGGVTRPGENILRGLGLSFEPVHVPIREVRMVYQDLVYAVYGNPIFRITRRDEFDHWLVQQAQQQGVAICQGEAVVEVTPRPDYVEVITEQATFRAKTVVAADGSRSLVRQKLKWENQGHMSRLVEVLTPEQAEETPEFQNGIAVFDFSEMTGGLQGYYWDFPSLVKGQAFMSRGVFDSRVRPERPHAGLKEVLQSALGRRSKNLTDYPLKGHPIHWFDRHAQFARPRIILAGDAAGVDPLLGEGIAFALAYGQVAAAALADAFARQDFNFSDYRRRILAHPFLAQLPVRTWIAHRVYNLKHPGLIRWGWSKTGLLIRCLAWYNPDLIPLESARVVKLTNRF
jgi:geranylgeranyl reductase family protein